eukprot:scaffold10854_cov155-Skeletonema_dohrnii-CCMP3373.AAC.4
MARFMWATYVGISWETGGRPFSGGKFCVPGSKIEAKKCQARASHEPDNNSMLTISMPIFSFTFGNYAALRSKHDVAI